MDVAELARQIEYKVAPEPLIAVQALANTFAFEPEEERLADRESARRWLVDSDLAVTDVSVSAADLDRLLELRRVVRAAIEANLAERPDVQAARDLAALAEAHPPRLVATPSGQLGLDLSPVTGVDEFAGQIVGIVFESQLEGLWPRLKICAFDECRWSFYDSSRNRGGTWCQMDVCGNRVKNRAYRRRRSAASAKR